MYKILTMMIMATGSLAASHHHANKDIEFLYSYALEKRDVALETIEKVYSDDVEMYMLGKSEAYTDMMYIMSFMIFQDTCD